MQQRILTLVAALLCSLHICAQEHSQTMADFAQWPSGVTNKTFELSNQGFVTITIGNITPAEKDKLLEKSSVAGRFGGDEIDKTLKVINEENTQFGKYDVSGKSLKLSFSAPFKEMEEQDSIVVTLIKEGSEPPLVFTLKGKKSADVPAAGAAGAADGTPNPLALNASCLEAYRKVHFEGSTPTYVLSDIGYKNKTDKYVIHIFLDQTGNFLYGSKPTGVQRKYHYVIHVLYNKNDQGLFRYAIDATGDLSDQLAVFNINTAVPKPQSAGTDPEKLASTCNNLIDDPFNIFPTTDDLSFNLYYIPMKNNVFIGTPVKIKSYVIKKTAYYYAAINAGLVYSWLGNPTYSLVDLPAGGDNKTVKVADNGGNVQAVVMSTIYFSIYNLLFPNGEKQGVKRKYSSWGRSYLDDEGNILRRIYPAIGFGLNGTVLTNYFAGFNIEPIQGFGVFVGQNIRKVNTFSMPGFKSGETTVTQSQFDFYQNSKFDNSWALGVIIDLSVFGKLVGSIQAPGTTP